MNWIQKRLEAALAAARRTRTGIARTHPRQAVHPVTAYSPIHQYLLEYSYDGLIISDMRGRIEWVNPAYQRIVGYDEDEILGVNPLSFVMPRERTPPQHVIDAYSYEGHVPGFLGRETKLNRRKNGKLFWNEITIIITPDIPGIGQRVILVCRDVTEVLETRQRLEVERDQMERLAVRDSLTGLANRVRLNQVLDQVLKNPAPEGRFVGLMQIDLDRFKSINDTYGHATGDKVLIHMADIIADVIGPRDLGCRIGGDEFVIISPETTSFDTLRDKAERIIKAQKDGFRWNDLQVDYGCTIGLALGTPGKDAGDDLMTQADYALYTAKNLTRGTIGCFDDRVRDQYNTTRVLLDELRRAITNNEFIAVFQPVMDTTSMRIVGFETLIRWNHPTRGILAPIAFLETAARHDLIHEIDRIAMECALAAIPVFSEVAGQSIVVSFNVAGNTLLRDSFLDNLKWAVDQHGLEPDRVVVEVLESTIFEDNDQGARKIIDAISNAGFMVALDDFGVGYAGLSHLAELNLYGVKLDRSLVANVATNETNRIICKAIVDLCSELGLRTIGEGVETDADVQTLLDMNCSSLQGYWLSKPMQRGDAIAYLAERSVIQMPGRKAG